MKTYIQNIIATASTIEVSLFEVSKHPNAEYDTKEKEAVILRFNKNVAVLVFPKGNIVITGAKSAEQVTEIANKVEKIIEDLK